ncbi:MAG TPA: cytochrome c [Dyella sp.]|uniref:c-type cytochrome n=1 Tax=Dyella sp. TaxID=1869338 RepID=UPI002BCFFCA0|nr:cytochrome c [Dyella sp.]HTV86626.1 cytochrome c [Dyella sp.]
MIRTRTPLHACVLVCALLLGAGLPGTARADSAGIYNPATLKAANGEQVYTHICQGCHMPDGKGAEGAGRYPAFVGNPKLASASYMAVTVLYGRHDMPSFMTNLREDEEAKFMRSAELSDAQIAEVINFIRTHFGNHYPDSLSAADVAALHPKAH